MGFITCTLCTRLTVASRWAGTLGMRIDNRQSSDFTFTIFDSRLSILEQIKKCP